MKKKAQVTLFIIIGIVILLLAVLFVYITREEVEKITPETDIAEKIPTELDPTKIYVEACIGEVLTEGLRLLGEHGGYIYQDSFIYIDTDPTQGNAMGYYPDSNFYVPYWYYMKSDNYCTGNCEFKKDMMPQLCKPNRNCITTGANSIEKQLDMYIKDNLRDCLDDFKPFKEQGIDIIELGNIEADTIIKDKEITVIVKYPLRIEKQDMTGEITRFTTTIYSDLAEMYEIAYDIVDYEMQNCFIGDHVRNYYSYYFGLDEKDLPPLYEMTIGTDEITVWNLEDVEENLKSKTVNAMYMLGIFNTSGFVWPSVPKNETYYETRQGVYDQFVFYPLRRYHDASVNIFYFNWWDPYLDIQPNKGNMLVPTELGGGSGVEGAIGSITKTKIYEFFYQYSFPVVVEIRKKDNVDREHIFRFALEENIRANKCFNANATLIHSTSVAQTLLCDEDQLVNDISISVKDKEGNASEDVSVSFYAGQTCLLGVTDEDGKLDTKYPDAYGAFLKFEKDDYVVKIVEEKDLEGTAEIELEKFKHFNATVKKYIMTQPNVCCNAAEDLTETEQVIFILEKVLDPNDQLDQELTQPMMFNGNDESTLVNDVKLIPGKYKIDATYIDNEEYTTQARCMKFCTGTDWRGDCDDYGYAPSEPQSTKPFGGALLNGTGGYWEISESDFEGKSKIEFYVLRVPDANCITTDNCILSPCIGLGEMDKVDDYSTTFRNDLLPVFKE